MVLDGYTGISGLKVWPAEKKITGYVSNNKDNKRNLIRSYLEVHFDKPFKSYGTWENRKNTIQDGELQGEGDGVGVYIQFKDGETVQAKVASSYISPEQAGVTLNAELGKFKNLEDTKAAAAKYGMNFLAEYGLKVGPKKKRPHFIPAFSEPVFFPGNFMNMIGRATLIISALTMEKCTRAICLPIRASGIRSGRSFR